MDRSQSCGGADPPPPRARLIRPSIRLMISSIFFPCARALHARMDSKQKKKTRETGTKVPRFTQKKKKKSSQINTASSEACTEYEKETHTSFSSRA
jgi:hypothetical protein